MITQTISFLTATYRFYSTRRAEFTMCIDKRHGHDYATWKHDYNSIQTGSDVLQEELSSEKYAWDAQWRATLTTQNMYSQICDTFPAFFSYNLLLILCKD